MEWRVNELADVILTDGQIRRTKVVRKFDRGGNMLYEVLNIEDQQTIYTVGPAAMRKVL